MEKEIFNGPVDERLEKITDLDKKVNRNDLLYIFKSVSSDENFDEFDNALDIINKIPHGKKDLADVKYNQNKFKSLLSEIKKGSNKSRMQKNTIYNIELLYKARNDAIKF